MTNKVLTYTLEADVDDKVKKILNGLGLVKNQDYNEKSAMSEYMKEALRGSAKTKSKTNYGIPDFHLEKYRIPVVIENKLHNKYHVSANKLGIKMDDKSIKTYAVNGAVYYAKNMIESKKYDEVIAVGVSADDENSVKISVYYVFSSNIEPKFMKNYTSLNFLENKVTFDSFYKEATVTEDEKHKILIATREQLLKRAKQLNKMMNNHNIGVDQRVVYVSGMLLSMQSIFDSLGNEIDSGLVPEDLTGNRTSSKRDGVLIVNHLQEYLKMKNIPEDKKNIMLSTFKMTISLDESRDIPCELDSEVSTVINTKASITKQIFSFLYHYIYTSISYSGTALDIMAEMYSTFLKYALSDGAQLGKVLTPPYITNLMAKILDVNCNSKVMDLATGSAAFLVASMDLMISDANRKFCKGSNEALKKIKQIKEQQLLGVEIDAKMYTLAASNMILRGDGSTNIQKADTFKTPESLYSSFEADTFLLNPPFSYFENGLPFFDFGLNHMKTGGKAAVIIQDSAGAGRGINTASKILKKHKMLASIKMPADLFMPNANVQTSIYIFEAGTPHNFELDIVKFIDFRNDGYKRTERVIKDIDNPIERYSDLYLIYKLGKNAVKNENFHKELWNLDEVYFEDTISDKGNDWNFEKHAKYDSKVNENSLTEAMTQEFSWNLVTNITKIFMNDCTEIKEFREKKKDKISVSKIFNINKVISYDKDDLTPILDKGKKYDYITRSTLNRGVCEYTGYIEEEGLVNAGTFSLGLLQMTFFYRENDWYAGQFMRQISCKFNIDKYAAIYLENALNTLSKKLLSGLVRDVDSTFRNSEILLPIDPEGNPDFKWMSNFMKKIEINIKDTIKKFL